MPVIPGNIREGKHGKFSCYSSCIPYESVSNGTFAYTGRLLSSQSPKCFVILPLYFRFFFDNTNNENFSEYSQLFWDYPPLAYLPLLLSYFAFFLLHFALFIFPEYISIKRFPIFISGISATQIFANLPCMLFGWIKQLLKSILPQLRQNNEIFGAFSAQIR